MCWDRFVKHQVGLDRVSPQSACSGSLTWTVVRQLICDIRADRGSSGCCDYRSGPPGSTSMLHVGPVALASLASPVSKGTPNASATAT